jgi:uncharacterized short protein YbdD (DUF466 family)
MGVATAVRSLTAGLAWYVRSVSGEDAYDRYLAHHESVHGANAVEPVMTARQFWRAVITGSTARTPWSR